MRIILAMMLIAAGTPLCTEIIMAKGRIIMRAAMVRVDPISRPISAIINTMPPAGATMLLGINTTEDMIIPLTMETAVDMMMTVITITSTAEATISGLPIDKRWPFTPTVTPPAKFSMAILEISLYNATHSRQDSEQT